MAGVRTATTKSVAYAPQVEKIPLLPGNNFHDDPINRATLRKSHGLGKSNAIPEFVPPTEYSETNKPQGYKGLGGSAARRMRVTKGELESQWAEHDDPFQFIGFFKEAVPESPQEAYRVRKVGITFFRNDSTLSIREAKTPNSGMMTSVHGGGALLVRRHVVYDTDGTPLDLEDLQIGEEFECYGRVFMVIGAHKNTREKLKELGWAVPEDLPFPEAEDVHAKHNARRMEMNPIRKLTSDQMDVKRQAEFAVVGRYCKAHPDSVRAAKQFLFSDGSRHLTFNALWDNRNESKGDLRLCALKYFPEDDTFEIAEKKAVNSGRDGGVKLLCRQRIPANENTTRSTHENTFGKVYQSGHLTSGDLYVGRTYRIHGKEFLVYDADSFTRDWFEKNHGRVLDPAASVDHILNRDVKALVKHYPPPHNGFGSEEDSLGNWRGLTLRPVRKDVQKILNEGHKVLRFKATFNNPRAPGDSDRRFVLHYYPATEEFEVLESTIRNSGIISGRFLGKTQVYKTEAETGRRVRLGGADVGEGKVVELLGREFLLGEIDSRSAKYRDGIEDPPEPEKIKHLIVMLKELLNQRYDRLAAALRHISTGGKVTVSDLERFFFEHNQPISRREAKTILHHFDTKQVGYVDFNSFVRMVEYGSAHNLDESVNRAAAVQVDAVLGDDDDENDVQDRAQAQKRLYQKTLRLLRDRLLQRRMKQQEVFRLMAGRQSDSRLDVKEFHYGLQHILHLQLSPEEKDILVGALFGPKDKVTFAEFSTFLEGVHELKE